MNDKVLAVITLDKDLHHWLEQLAVVDEGQRFDLSGQINQLLRAAKDSNNYSVKKDKSVELEIEQINMLKTILQTCVESLMIMRSQFLSESGAQAKLTTDIKDLLKKQFAKLSDEKLVREHCSD